MQSASSVHDSEVETQTVGQNYQQTVQMVKKFINVDVTEREYDREVECESQCLSK